MDIYVLFLNGIKHKQFKLEKDALEFKDLLLSQTIDNKIKIIHEEYIDDFSYYDTGCKVDLIYEN